MDPTQANALLQAAREHHQQGHLAEAQQAYQQFLTHFPDHPDGLFGMGTLALQAQQDAAAEQLFRRFLSQNPMVAMGHYYLAMSLACQDRMAEATRSLEQSVTLDPNLADAHASLGRAYLASGRQAEAISSCQKALTLAPNNVMALHILADSHAALGHLPQAQAAYQQVVALQPNAVAALNNLGRILGLLKQPREAEAAYRQMIAAAPNIADGHASLGTLLKGQGRLAEAEESLRSALKLAPENPWNLIHLAGVVFELGNNEEALKLAEQAVRQGPQIADSHAFLAHQLARLTGHKQRALNAYRQAIKLAPERGEILGQLMHLERNECDWDGYQHSLSALNTLLQHGTDKGLDPFQLMNAGLPPTVQLNNAVQFCQDLFDYSGPGEVAPFQFSGTAKETLVIGYLSGDFRNHIVGELAAELFASHNRTRVKVIAYARNADDGGTTRARIAKACDTLVDTHGMAVSEVAQRIHDDGVDILVDLTGHTHYGYPCLGVMSWRPAPIQAHLMGFPGTIGAGFVDYLIADAVVAPAENADDFVENLVRLPGCYLPNHGNREVSEQTPDRAAAGLPDSGFVFCSFNDATKISPPVFDCWMAILKRVPDSVLWLKVRGDTTQTNLEQRAARHGIDPARLVFAQRVDSLGDHLARHRLADLFLDTTPFNAHSTGADALWMGLPILTCSGDSFTSRVAASLLTQVGLSELITHHLDDYQALAVALANDPQRMAALKAKLLENRAPLFDCDRYARHLEQAYATMWQRHQSGHEPDSFTVPSLS